MKLYGLETDASDLRDKIANGGAELCAIICGLEDAEEREDLFRRQCAIVTQLMRCIGAEPVVDFEEHVQRGLGKIDEMWKLAREI